jgi:hypothetical protein
VVLDVAEEGGGGARKGWPFVGECRRHLWTLAATNMKVALAEVVSMLRPFGGMLLGLVQSALFALLELRVSITIAGFTGTPRSPGCGL